MTFITHFGIPQSITCDNSTEFKTSLLIDFCKLHNIKLHFTTPGNSNSNSPVERLHSTLIENFRVLNLQEPKLSTKEAMKYAVLGYNNSVHSVTKQKPFDIISGRLNNIDPFNLTDELILNQFISNKRDRLKTLYNKIYETSLTQKTHIIEKRNENREEPPTHKPNSLAYIKNKGAKRNKAKQRHFKTKIFKDLGTKVKTTKGKILHKSQLKKPHTNKSNLPGHRENDKERLPDDHVLPQPSCSYNGSDYNANSH
jgi:hypothetical protein